MRSEPLILEKYRPGTGTTHEIKEMELIEPFGSVVWGDHIVYITPSINAARGIMSTPRSYIYYDAGKVRFSGVNCIGDFFRNLPPEERKQFNESIVEIMEALSL